MIHDLWKLLPESTIEVIHRKVVEGEVVTVEGPNGVGKTTFVRSLASYFGIPYTQGPRPPSDTSMVEDSTVGEPYQTTSEIYLREVCPDGRRLLILDRGWASIDFYRKLFSRSEPSSEYGAMFPADSGPTHGIVIFMDADDDVLDQSLVDHPSHESKETIVAERVAWREYAEMYSGSKVMLRRMPDGTLLDLGYGYAEEG